MLLASKVLSGFRNILGKSRFPLSIVHPNVYVDTLSSLELNCVVFPHVKVMDSKVGAFSYIQEGSNLFRTDVGRYTSIAGNVTIGYPDHPLENVSTSPVFYDRLQPLPFFFDSATEILNNENRTIIGHDVWIGQNSFVKAGRTIGIGSIIGAGSIVTSDIPPYSIAAGNPCKVIRPRFSGDIASQLIESKWWDMDVVTLNSLTSYFTDPAQFLKEYSKL